MATMSSPRSDDQPVTTVVRRPGRPRDARADHAILEAAIDLAAEVGLAELTIDAVAARAGVSKATIYRRWDSKEALMLDALGVTHAIHRESGPDTGSLRGDLQELARRAFDALSDNRIASCLPDILAASRVSPELRPLADRLFQEKSESVRQILSKAVARGEIPADTDFDLVHALMFGPMFFLMFTGHQIELELVNSVIDNVLAGLTTPER
jgi:AcrR family transcriptional regulator